MILYVWLECTRRNSINRKIVEEDAVQEQKWSNLKIIEFLHASLSLFMNLMSQKLTNERLGIASQVNWLQTLSQAISDPVWTKKIQIIIPA